MTSIKKFSTIAFLTALFWTGSAISSSDGIAVEAIAGGGNAFLVETSFAVSTSGAVAAVAASEPVMENLKLASLGSVSSYNAATPAEESKASVSAVPLPASIWLFGAALLGFIAFARRTSV